MSKRTLKIGLITFCIISFIGHRLLLLYQKITAPHPMPPIVVSTTMVEVKNIPIVLPAIGTLKAVNAVTLSAAMDGIVQSIPVQSGQSVRQGDLIVQLESNVEQADVDRFQSALTMSEHSLKRSSSLTSQNIQSQSTLEQKQTDYDQNRAQLTHAQSIVKRKQIRAPFGGVLGIFHIDVGEYLKPGNAVVTLTDASKLYVNFTRPEQDKTLLQCGQKVVVRVDAFPNREFKAIITGIEPQINEDTRVVNVQASLDNPDNCLSPGMYASLDVIVPVEQNSITVPDTAIDYSLYGTSVYVIETQQSKATGQQIYIPHRQAVKVGKPYHGFVAIEHGLKPQDQVISAGTLKVQDNMPVLIKNDISLIPQASYRD